MKKRKQGNRNQNEGGGLSVRLKAWPGRDR